MNTFPFTPQQLLHFDLLSCMQEAVFEPFLLASKLNVAGSIPVTRFQKTSKTPKSSSKSIHQEKTLKTSSKINSTIGVNFKML